ncbi:MAG: hypothetical protein JXA30_20970 [Deltaproteobacteria bacterium]|nr:hypothetical protein [Deltaproteobacteria bacterium]
MQRVGRLRNPCKTPRDGDSTRETNGLSRDLATRGYTREELFDLAPLFNQESEQARPAGETTILNGIGPTSRDQTAAARGDAGNALGCHREPSLRPEVINRSAQTTMAILAQNRRCDRKEIRTIGGNRACRDSNKKDQTSHRLFAGRFLQLASRSLLSRGPRMGVGLLLFVAAALGFARSGGVLHDTDQMPGNDKRIKGGELVVARQARPPRQKAVVRDPALSKNEGGKGSNAEKVTESVRNTRREAAVATETATGERAAVDELIASRIERAYALYGELAKQRIDKPVYRVITDILRRRIAESRHH